RARSGIHWARPELVAEIEFAGWTADGMVRQAAFKGLREDKPARDVQAEEPADPGAIDLAEPAPARGASRGGARPSEATSGKSAPRPRKPAAPARKPAVMGVLLSNADKRLWPEDDDAQSITKIELARYFEQVGEWLLAHIRGRPCSIIRAP